MVRFCGKCKRAMDDSDKFCRFCGNDSNNSIDYYTYYRQSPSLNIDIEKWVAIGKDIAIRQDIKELKEKVERIYQSLFPDSEELGK